MDDKIRHLYAKGESIYGAALNPWKKRGETSKQGGQPFRKREAGKVRIFGSRKICLIQPVKSTKEEVLKKNERGEAGGNDLDLFSTGKGPDRGVGGFLSRTENKSVS